MSSGSAPPRYVTLTVPSLLQASVSLSVNSGEAGPDRLGVGWCGARRGRRSAAAPGGAPSRPPSPPSLPPLGSTSAAHEAAIKGKRWQVSEPNLVIGPQAARRAARSFLPELPVCGGPGGGVPGWPGAFETRRLRRRAAGPWGGVSLGEVGGRAWGAPEPGTCGRRPPPPARGALTAELPARRLGGGRGWREGRGRARGGPLARRVTCPEGRGCC